jgi:hypothetical protein
MGGPIDRYVISKSLHKRIGCDGPISQQYAEAELLQELKAAGLVPDVDFELAKKPLPQPRAKRGRPKRRDYRGR